MSHLSEVSRCTRLGLLASAGRSVVLLIGWLVGMFALSVEARNVRGTLPSTCTSHDLHDEMTAREAV